jgi:hypothetical protein
MAQRHGFQCCCFGQAFPRAKLDMTWHRAAPGAKFRTAPWVLHAAVHQVRFWDCFRRGSTCKLHTKRTKLQKENITLLAPSVPIHFLAFYMHNFCYSPKYVSSRYTCKQWFFFKKKPKQRREYITRNSTDLHKRQLTEGKYVGKICLFNVSNSCSTL